MAHQRKIAVIGLGYVGLPVAIAFARSGAVVIGFDVDRKRIRELQASFDRTREVEESDLSHPTLSYVSDPETLRPTSLLSPYPRRSTPHAVLI